MKDYTYFGTIITNKNELRPKIEKKSYKHVEHIVHFFSTQYSEQKQKSVWY